MKKPKMVRRPDAKCPHCKGTGMSPGTQGGLAPCQCIALRVEIKPTDWRGR
jgi:hypothetical protein